MEQFFNNPELIFPLLNQGIQEHTCASEKKVLPPKKASQLCPDTKASRRSWKAFLGTGGVHT
jgi:hypothetical protein